MPVYEKCKVFTCKHTCNLPVIINSVLCRCVLGTLFYHSLCPIFINFINGVKYFGRALLFLQIILLRKYQIKFLEDPQGSPKFQWKKKMTLEYLYFWKLLLLIKTCYTIIFFSLWGCYYLRRATARDFTVYQLAANFRP